MKTQQIIAGVLVGFILLFATYQATRPDPNLLRFEVQGERAYGFGTTDDRSVGVINKLLQDHPQVTTLVLKSMPGTKDADINLIIARRIRKAGLNTHLEFDSRIASGAVDLFLAGTERTMECGAAIGVHSWAMAIYEPKAGHYDRRKTRQEKFLRDMGINPAFYVFTRDAAPASSIHIMSPKEINQFDLLSAPLAC